MPKAKAEKPSETAPEGTEAGNDLVKKPFEGFKRTKSVSLPTLKWETGSTIYVEFLKPIEVRKTVDPKTKEEKDIEVAVVRNLENDRQYDLVCGVVLKKEMDIVYENDSYKGKVFELTKHPVKGKRYHTFEIYEGEV